MNSQIFSELSQNFQSKIYHSFKGKLRLAILKRDFDLFQFHQTPLKILDIGAGQGQFAYYLASKGHHITLLEPENSMLEIARKHFSESSLKATFLDHSIEDLPSLSLGKFDLILCHAVLEWLQDPYNSIKQLKSLLTPNGHLSLLFYNLEGLIYHNLIRGNFRYVLKKSYSGQKGGLTPISPIDTSLLEATLRSDHYRILHKSGIRTYYDFMTKENRNKISEEEHLEMELEYSLRSDYLAHARYHHWIIKANV